MKHLSSEFYAPAIAGASILCLTAQPISAVVLHNGWQYAIDVSYDSVGSVNGVLTTGSPTIYEMYGMAIFDDIANNRIWVGFTRVQSCSQSWGSLSRTFSRLPNSLIPRYGSL